MTFRPCDPATLRRLIVLVLAILIASASPHAAETPKSVPSGRVVPLTYNNRLIAELRATMGANGPHDWDEGWEYFYQADTTRTRLLTFGFGLSPCLTNSRGRSVVGW